MKLNVLEKMLVNSPVRAYLQWRLETPWFLNRVSLPKASTVLEIGCGRGEGMKILLAEARKRGTPIARAHGCDLDERMIHLAQKQNLGNVSWQVADATLLPYPNNTFDAVFDYGILHHVPNWQLGIAEVARVLKPNGTFYALEYYRRLICAPLIRNIIAHPQTNRFNHQEFLQELKAHNLHPRHQTQIANIVGLSIFVKNK